MTLIRHHFVRSLSILCGLFFISACQQQALVPTPPKLIKPAAAVMVIELDLTQTPTPSPTPNLQTSSTEDKTQEPTDAGSVLADAAIGQVQQPPKRNINKDLAVLLAASPENVTPAPPPTLGQGIVEIIQIDQILPPLLERELDKIYQLPKAIQYAYLLAMAEKILPLGYAQTSVRILNKINLDQLPENQLGRYFEVRAESQLKLGDSFGAITWLHQAQALTPDSNPQARFKLLTLKAKAYETNDLPLSAAKTLIALSQLPNVLDPSVFNERIWSALTQLSSHTLGRDLSSTETELTSAWHALALIPLIHHDIDQQLTALQQWQQQWPMHPAAAKLPGALASLAELSVSQPQRIALAMPLHGKLGKVGQAVLDGFMAARFEAQSGASVIPSIKIYDTTDLRNLDALYLQAAADQIDMVIGPIDKDRVIQLSQKDALTIPTLALNYIPLGSHQKTTTNLVQFGLAVEDEASQLATRSFSEGHRRIVVLHQDQPWAIRAAQHFSSSWVDLGGKIATQVSFSGSGDHSTAITQALLINQSHERAKVLKKHLAGSGNTVKFEPRRRQDVDAIVLFSLPTDGRQIIPTLAFHYAADLPVYASHHIYQGPTETSRDRDLEKVIFTELPWLIEQPDIQKKVSQKWPGRDRYTRLFAIGVDAYRLFPRLEQLQAFSNSRVHGVTGLLQMNEQGRIFTHSSWGKFKAGKVVVDPR